MITNFILYLTIIAHSRHRKQTNKSCIVYAAAFETAEKRLKRKNYSTFTQPRNEEIN